MQKGKIQDYESFKNEINILMGLVSAASYSGNASLLIQHEHPHSNKTRGFSLTLIGDRVPILLE